jgi:hypothetical protein
MATEFAQGTGNPAIAPIMRGAVASAFALQEGSRLRENAFGLDEITRVWIGPKAIARAFALSQTTDPEFPGLYKVDHDIALMAGGLAAVTVDYRGRATNVPGAFNAYTDASLSPQSTSFLVYLSNGGTLTVSLQYLAPSTTYRWWESTRPADTPRYKTVSSSLNPWDYVQSTRIALPSGASITSSALQTLMTYLRNNYKPVTQIVAYEPRESVKSRYWECESKVSRLLNQPFVVQR